MLLSIQRPYTTCRQHFQHKRLHEGGFTEHLGETDMFFEINTNQTALGAGWGTCKAFLSGHIRFASSKSKSERHKRLKSESETQFAREK